MKSLFLSCVLLVVYFAAMAQGDNWPGWRGPDNNGISKETNLPLRWSETENIAWKLALPPLSGKGGSGSTPAIWGDRIFLTSREGKNVVLICVGTDGKQRWKKTVGGSDRLKYKPVETNDSSNSPSTDGKFVYALSGAGDFVCFDFDGKEIWRYDVIERYGKFSTYHGMHTSPLLHGDRLYLTLLSAGGHWIVAIDKTTGNDAWKVQRFTDAKGENVDAYTSPFVWNSDKGTCLVVGGCDYVTGHSMTDGKELWRLFGNPKRTPAWRIIPSPVATPDLLVVCTGRSPGPIFGIKPGVTGTVEPNGPYVQWNIQGAPDVPTPLIHDGLVYFCKAENGRLTCVDAKNGKEVYDNDVHDVKYRSSPIFADGRIICTAFDGHFSVVKAGRDFELLAENVLQDNFTASPAISNGRIYLRGWRSLYAVSVGGK